MNNLPLEVGRKISLFAPALSARVLWCLNNFFLSLPPMRSLSAIYTTILPRAHGCSPDVTCCGNSRYIELFCFSCENPERAPAAAKKGRLRQSKIAWKLASVPLDNENCNKQLTSTKNNHTATTIFWSSRANSKYIQ